MKNIKKFRGKLNMTQDELAQKTGLSRTQIHNLENDETTTTKATMQKLCEALQTNPIELYGIDNLIYKPTSKEEYLKLKEIIRFNYKEWED